MTCQCPPVERNTRQAGMLTILFLLTSFVAVRGFSSTFATTTTTGNAGITPAACRKSNPRTATALFEGGDNDDNEKKRGVGRQRRLRQGVAGRLERQRQRKRQQRSRSGNLVGHPPKLPEFRLFGKRCKRIARDRPVAGTPVGQGGRSVAGRRPKNRGGSHRRRRERHRGPQKENEARAGCEPAGHVSRFGPGSEAAIRALDVEDRWIDGKLSQGYGNHANLDEDGRRGEPGHGGNGRNRKQGEGPRGGYLGCPGW
mmetsp:Transcript_113214/g.231724  ORF Transcript_113214/g.231724 Transcript_113214/m.231724 type:complete len:256 (-) Transcript_113214:2968-3735(-)